MSVEILRIEHLTKHFGSLCAVDDLSLAVNEGEIFGFIGPNGAGKSTTIRCVMDLLNKDGGEVFLREKPLRRKDFSMRSVVGYLPSEVFLYEEMTVAATLRYSAGFYARVNEQKTRDLLDRLQLDTAKKVGSLSLGNLKKLGIVLSLMHDPELVIMDEATSGLDPLMQETFYDILREEKARGTTFFFSSHNLTEVQRLCDRVGMIREGRLKKVDAIDNIVPDSVRVVTLKADGAEALRPLSDSWEPRPDGSVRFTTKAAPDVLITALAGIAVSKLLVEEPTLEEIFLHYYR